MLKRVSIRKIAVTTCALFIITMLYFFPTKTDTITLKQNVTYENTKKNAKVFLLDKNDYISLVSVALENKDTTKQMKEAVLLLIKNSEKKEYLPKNFKATIPKNTKIISLTLKDKIVTINFSKEILNVKEENEEKMIESIVYTLTEFKDVEGVKILVNNKAYNEKYNKVLDRSIGVNKIYDIDSLEGITHTTIYYIGEANGDIYYTPVTKINNDKREKIAVIIDELKSSLVYQSNLSSYLNSNAELKDYEIKESVMHLTFNDKIFDSFDTKNILEEVKYTIGKSIKDNYDVDEVIFYVEGEEITKTVLKTLEN